MQHVLRAISGPHAGAVYVLGSRTTIGRASDCDIQILHEGVSRHHAKLTLEDDGTVVVADLSSDNGTFVEDERVERHVLSAGEVVRIMRSRFAYERLGSEEARTSATFQRKVTSGDSLRQTIHHDRPLAAVRAGLSQGLPGGMMGERPRPYSRPQAAAPALSGARPGAATGWPAGVEAPGPEHPSESVDETPRVRRPTPPLGIEAGASVRERRSRPAPANEARPAPSRMVTRPPEPARADEPRPGEGVAAASPATQGRHVALGQGRRERGTATLGSLVASTGASSARGERTMGPPPPSGPSGRMAPLAPSGGEHEPEPHAPAAASSATLPGPMHGTGPMGSGWIRINRPLDAPGSMRPGSTLTGVPQVGADTSTPMASPPIPSAARTTDGGGSKEGAGKHTTAEYGAVGSREITERAVPPPTAAPEPAPAGEAESELDAMKTLPTLRRVTKHGSVTPTEKVPRIRGGRRSVRPLDDDTHATKPRVTMVPRERGPAPAPDEVEPQERAVPEHADREHEPREGLERLVDILEYRELRLRALQSRSADAEVAERCAALEQALRQRAPAGDERAAMRRYHRFACSIPAQLTYLPRGTSSTAAVELEDLSAGGAKITFGQHSLGAGETVWLTIDLASADRSRIPSPEACTVVLKARVVWAQPHEAKLGLVFAGAPQFA